MLPSEDKLWDDHCEWFGKLISWIDVWTRFYKIIIYFVLNKIIYCFLNKIWKNDISNTSIAKKSTSMINTLLVPLGKTVVSALLMQWGYCSLPLSTDIPFCYNVHAVISGPCEWLLHDYLSLVQYKDCLSRHGDSHVKDKMVLWLYYL